MNLTYDLTIEQQQKLIMTPELIQAIKILQYNRQELDSYINDQILTNPVLENSESQISKEELRRERLLDYIKDYGKNGNSKDENYSGHRTTEGNVDSYEKYIATGVSLQEHLLFQLQFAVKGKTAYEIAEFIIEGIDDNGYMTSTIPEIAETFSVGIECVTDLVEVVQNFDPIGVCAINLGDCLKRQLEQKGLLCYTAEHILENYIEEIAANKLSFVAKELGVSVGKVQEVRDLIKTLDPKPGLEFAKELEGNYVVPDIIVTVEEGEYIVTHKEGKESRLMISSYYEKLFKASKDDPSLNEYLSKKIDSALWVMKSIEQRKQTILNVGNAIVDFQKDFFEQGEKHLKTMTLKEIAEKIEVHESTVSRAINGKYLQCDRGVFELRYFFSAGVSAGDGEGGIASKSIKMHIRELVHSENHESPLSDQKLVGLLKERDIDISRRTIAKYRDEMGIPSSSKRKRY